MKSFQYFSVIFVSILLFTAGNSFKIKQQKRQAGSILGAATKLVVTQVAKSIAKYLMHNLVQQSPYVSILKLFINVSLHIISIYSLYFDSAINCFIQMTYIVICKERNIEDCRCMSILKYAMCKSPR